MTNIFDTHIVFDHSMFYDKLQFCLDNDVCGYICSINSNILVEIFRNKNYKFVINSSLFNFCDGSLVCLFSNLLLQKSYNTLPGPQLFFNFIKKTEYKHCVLGSTPEVLLSISNKFSNENIICYELPFLDVNQFDYEKIAFNLFLNKVDFVWVSLGAPKQEIFSFNLSKYLKRGLVIPVGAAFYYSLNIPPSFVFKYKLFWLFRVFKEPKKTISRLFLEFLFMPFILIKQVFKCIF